MNKYILFFLLVFLSTDICTAQVGIGTENPIGLLNVDASKNNTSSLLNVEFKDDLIFKLNINKEANLVIGGSPSEKETSLELNATNKALLLNRVALKSVSDKITITASRNGMLVYNTNTAGEHRDAVTPGSYINMNGEWLRLVDKASHETNISASGIGELTTNVSVGEITDISTGAGAVEFPLYQNIVINEDGWYVFSFRLYGSQGSSTSQSVDDYYLYLFKKNGDSEELLNRIDMVIGRARSNSTYNTYFPIMHTPYLNVNDEIIIKMGRRYGADHWTLRGSSNKLEANRTSFVYWKIQ